MKYDLSNYRNLPVGEQLGVHFTKRAQLRSQVPLFSFSVSKIARKFELDTRTEANKTDEISHAPA